MAVLRGFFFRFGILIGILFLLGGCKSTPSQSRSERIDRSSSELAKTLAEVVDDEARLIPLLKLADEAAFELQRGSRELSALQQEQGELFANYSSTPADLAEIDQRMASRRTQLIETILELRHQMAALTTDEEWKKITSRDEAIFSMWEES